jgi:hypothetical protein
LWKSHTRVLQSCYKRTLTTFCTRERRDKKPFRMNVLTLRTETIDRRMVQHQSVAMRMQETEQIVVHVLSLDDRSTNCGTTKKEYEAIAPNRRRTLF